MDKQHAHSEHPSVVFLTVLTFDTFRRLHCFLNGPTILSCNNPQAAISFHTAYCGLNLLPRHVSFMTQNSPLPHPSTVLSTFEVFAIILWGWWIIFVVCIDEISIFYSLGVENETHDHGSPINFVISIDEISFACLKQMIITLSLTLLLNPLSSLVLNSNTSLFWNS